MRGLRRKPVQRTCWSLFAPKISEVENERLTVRAPHTPHAVPHKARNLWHLELLTHLAGHTTSRPLAPVSPPHILVACHRPSVQRVA